MRCPVVLWAEASEADRGLIRASLREVRRGAKVEFAATGHELLERAFSQPIDLIVSDMHASGVNGIEAAQQLRSHAVTRHTPIVFFAQHPPTDPALLNDLQIAGVYTKPTGFTEFQDVVAEILQLALGNAMYAGTPADLYGAPVRLLPEVMPGTLNAATEGIPPRASSAAPGIVPPEARRMLPTGGSRRAGRP